MQNPALKQKINNAIAYIEMKASTLSQSDGKFRRVYEKRLENKLVRRFNIQMKWVLEEMKNLSFFNQPKGINLIERKDAKSEVEAMASNLPEKMSMAEDIVAVSRTVYRKGARTISQQLEMSKYGLTFELVNEDAVAYLNKLRTIHLSDYRGSISRETKKRIIRIITDAAQNGDSYQEAGRKITAQGEAGVFSRARSELIAINQVGRAYGEGNKAMVDRFIRDTGTIIQKTWITVNDDKVTPECMANQDMGWLGYNESFNSGDRIAPRQSNPRCRCDTGYRSVDTQGNLI